MNHPTLYLAIAAMAAVTGFCRVVPFLLPRKSRFLMLLSSDHPSVRIVGPALLVGLAITTFGQPVLQSPHWSTTMTYGVGGLVTTGVFRWSRSVGLAVIVAILAFGLTHYSLTLSGL